jgi:hypothetical protein
MTGRFGGVIQGSFERPGEIGRADRLRGAPARVGPAGRSWLLPPSMVAAGRGAGGEPLPRPVRQAMERLFAADLGDVRVHVRPEVRSLGASALTSGQAVLFAPGHYAPGTPSGRRLLGHELTHVIQQRAGRASNPFGSGTALVVNAALEAEADHMGARALAAARIGGGGGDGLGELVEQARGKSAADEFRRRFPAQAVSLLASGRLPTSTHGLPEAVYHGTGAVLDRYPSGLCNWFTWDLEAAKQFSGSVPGESLVYRYGVTNRGVANLLILRHPGEFAKRLDRMMAEQGKSIVDGWIELEPGASLMLSRPSDYLRFEAVMGMVPSTGGGGHAAWSGWRTSVEQVEAGSGLAMRFPRGRRGRGNRGAYDRLLAQEIARLQTLSGRPVSDA